MKVSGAVPSARNYHTACCIAGPLTGQEHPLLMVFGGCDAVNPFGDVWLLDVDKGVWRQVSTDCVANTVGMLFIENFMSLPPSLPPSLSTPLPLSIHPFLSL